MSNISSMISCPLQALPETYTSEAVQGSLLCSVHYPREAPGFMYTPSADKWDKVDHWCSAGRFLNLCHRPSLWPAEHFDAVLGAPSPLPKHDHFDRSNSVLLEPAWR